MSKQKKLRSRLKDLFSDLEQERSQLPEQLEPTAGWVWECDAQGLYRACSPQTGDVLGVEAEEFIGQPFGTFRLSPQSTQILAAALTGQDFPLEITLDFLAQNGALVATRVNIFNGSSLDPDSGGFHGFNQVIQEQEKIADVTADVITDPLPEILSEESEASAATEHPATPRIGTGRLKPPSAPGSLPRGIAVENDQFLSVSRPLTSAGRESLASQQTITLASSYDSPAVLAVPLALQTQGFGLLEITDGQPGRTWSEDERRLVEEIADQLSLALENARLFQETSARSEELALINRVVARVAGSLDMNESLQVIASELGQALRVRMGIALMNETRSALIVAAEYTPRADQPASLGTEIPIAGNASTERVLETRKPVIIARAQSDPLTASIHKLMRQYGILSLAIFPIIVGNEVIGTLGIDILEENRQLTAEEIRLVETVIAQASTAIQNARLFEAEQRRRQIADTLSETARVVGATLDLQEVSDRLLRQ
ncbi:MAG: GAF domain-containing protein, partial [Anaerolineales bacterium]|nr:GAF domain-containing protein [Anaerolineales bacterium]